MNELEIFNYIGAWIKANPLLSGSIGGALCLVVGFIKPERVKLVGRAFSDLLKRIPVVGGLLEKKIEVIVDNFEDGMKSDSLAELPKMVNNSQKTEPKQQIMSDYDVNCNECPSKEENPSDRIDTSGN